jgi:hypothetical protein
VNRVVTYICVVLVALGVALGSGTAAQTSATPVPAPKKTAPSADIFSGTVTKLTEESVTVVRKVAGHEAVTREFMRDGTTTVEGKLREKVRVNVRYKKGEDGGFVAVYIIVR